MIKSLVLFSLLAGGLGTTGSALASTVVDYENLSAPFVTVLSSSYDLNGVTASVATGQLERSNGGLGVVGGVQDYFIDGSESVRFNFDAGSATGVSFYAPLIQNLFANSGVSRPQASLTIYNVGGSVQGTYAFLPFMQPNFETNVSAYTSGAISGFSVSGVQTALAIATITYTAPVSAAPEPASFLLFGAGLLALGAFRAKKTGTKLV